MKLPPQGAAALQRLMQVLARLGPARLRAAFRRLRLLRASEAPAVLPPSWHDALPLLSLRSPHCCSLGSAGSGRDPSRSHPPDPSHWINPPRAGHGPAELRSHRALLFIIPARSHRSH
ncbi:hypothetical protein NDU88_008469 [Pleurodeles waltl]|uniref:Uncharacterized protein n=1 Tax=Pleurodeles waltl TaxID=8319 RepID=A0AAV7N6K5_PLEWA|nr:hypothetical protein NDU88_008469 [Pleurodeles waltl]